MVFPSDHVTQERKGLVMYKNKYDSMSNKELFDCAKDGYIEVTDWDYL